MERSKLVDLREQKPAVPNPIRTLRGAWLDVPCFGPTWSTTAAQGMRHVLLRGKVRPIFFVKTWEAGESRCATLSAMRCRAGQAVHGDCL